jgi:hypothetical protein
LAPLTMKGIIGDQAGASAHRRPDGDLDRTGRTHFARVGDVGCGTYSAPTTP